MAGGVTRRVALGAGAGVVAVGVLTAGAASAVASTGPAGVAAAAPSGGAPVTAPAVGGAVLPTRSQFAGHVGETFDGASPWSSHRLVLREVADLTPPGPDPEHCFRLEFAADGAARDGLYRLVSPAGDELALFLSRVGGGAPTLAAIVDRSR